MFETDFTTLPNFIQGIDFIQGVHAAVIDKSNLSRWEPSSLSQATSDHVALQFESLGTLVIEELGLAKRGFIHARGQYEDGDS